MERRTIEDLRKVIVLNDLPEEHLKWLAERVEYDEYDDGDLMTRKNDPRKKCCLFLKADSIYI
jgi:hypothetical protein